MPITREQVDYVARLARLELTEEEKERFAGQLDAIIAYMDKLNELDTSQVEPMVHGIEGRQAGRPDRVRESLPRRDALCNAPESSEGCFRVPRIIE
ncbi:MAG: Asp-tRNA(Asn)/Glu-tRNA(Gln) amidotransferase subunit GatC [Candidatus Brocadiaceae bacterium]|jgi:aspartyl-tRNA(Asn)/glutamyl-tRNA(Gln) amidotransferase subunit C